MRSLMIKKLRFWTFLIGISSLSILWSAASARDFAGGTGEPNDPYQIATSAQLVDLGNDPCLYDKHFVLTSDIDMQGIGLTRAVIAWDLNAFDFDFTGTAFRGTLDGADFQILNLTIDTGSAENGQDYLGLFGYVDANAVIKNLSMTKCTIKGGINSDFLGAIAGEMENGVMEGCSMSGTLTSESNSQNIGGLVGYGIASRLDHCYADCTVTTKENSSVIGGLAGGLVESRMTDCEASASLYGDTQL